MLTAIENSAYILVQIGVIGSINEIMKLSLRVLEYIHNTCTKSSPKCIGTP